MKFLPGAQQEGAWHAGNPLFSCRSDHASSNENIPYNGSTSHKLEVGRKRLNGGLSRGRKTSESATSVLDSVRSRSSVLNGNCSGRDPPVSLRLSRQPSTTASTVLLLTPQTTNQNRPPSSRPVSSLISPTYLEDCRRTGFLLSATTPTVDASVTVSHAPATEVVRPTVTVSLERAITVPTTSISTLPAALTPKARSAAAAGARDAAASAESSSTTTLVIPSAAASSEPVSDHTVTAAHNVGESPIQGQPTAEVTSVTRPTPLAAALPPQQAKFSYANASYCRENHRYRDVSEELSEVPCLQQPRAVPSRRFENPILQLDKTETSASYCCGVGVRQLNSSTGAATASGVEKLAPSIVLTATPPRTPAGTPGLAVDGFTHGQSCCATLQQQSRCLLHDDDSNSLASFPSSSWTAENQTESPANSTATANETAALIRGQQAVSDANSRSNHDLAGISHLAVVNKERKLSVGNAEESATRISAAASVPVHLGQPGRLQEWTVTSTALVLSQTAATSSAAAAATEETTSVGVSLTQNEAPAATAATCEEGSVSVASTFEDCSRWSPRDALRYCHMQRRHKAPAEQTFSKSGSDLEESGDAERSSRANSNWELQIDNGVQATARIFEKSYPFNHEQHSMLQEQRQERKNIGIHVQEAGVPSHRCQRRRQGEAAGEGMRMRSSEAKHTEQHTQQSVSMKLQQHTQEQQQPHLVTRPQFNKEEWEQQQHGEPQTIQQYESRQQLPGLQQNEPSRAAGSSVGFTTPRRQLPATVGESLEAAAVYERLKLEQRPTAASQCLKRSSSSKKGSLRFRTITTGSLSRRTCPLHAPTHVREQEQVALQQQNTKARALDCTTQLQHQTKQEETKYQQQPRGRREQEVSKHTLEREREQKSQDAQKQETQREQQLESHGKQQLEQQDQEHQQLPQQNGHVQVPQQQPEVNRKRVLSLPPLLSLSPCSRREVRSRMRQWMLLRERRQQQQVTRNLPLRIGILSGSSAATATMLQQATTADAQNSKEARDLKEGDNAEEHSVFLRTASEAVKEGILPGILPLFKKLSGSRSR